MYLIIILVFFWFTGVYCTDTNRWIGISSHCVRPYGLKKPIICYPEFEFIPGNEYELFAGTTPSQVSTSSTSTTFTIPTTTTSTVAEENATPLTTVSSFFTPTIPLPTYSHNSSKNPEVQESHTPPSLILSKYFRNNE